MPPHLVSLVLLVVLYGSVSSEDQLGSRPSHSPTSARNQTVATDGEQSYYQDGQSEPVTLDVESTPAHNLRQRRYALASDQRPLDYEFFRGVGYYKLHTKAETWEQARRICESEGAHLMILNSEAEIRIIRSFLARALPTPGSQIGTVFFVGFHDHDTEGQYVTVLGEPVSATGYTRWLPNQINNSGRKDIDLESDCGCIHTNGMYIDDCWCTLVLAFWCEMPL